MNALSAISESHQSESNSFALDAEQSEIIKTFMPRLLDQAALELYRSRLSDIIILVQGYHDLWKAQVIPDAQYGDAHKHCRQYLTEYLAKLKR